MSPLYAYECEGCGQQQSEMRKIEERDDGPKCDRCFPRQKMQLVLCPVAGIVKDPAVPRRSK